MYANWKTKLMLEMCPNEVPAEAKAGYMTSIQEVGSATRRVGGNMFDIRTMAEHFHKKYVLNDEQGITKLKNSRAYLLLAKKMRTAVLGTENPVLIDEIKWIVSNNDILQIPAYSMTKDKLITVLDLFVEDESEEFVRMGNIASCQPGQVRSFMIATMAGIKIINRFTEAYPNEIQVWRFVEKFCNNVGRYLEPRHYNLLYHPVPLTAYQIQASPDTKWTFNLETRVLQRRTDLITLGLDPNDQDSTAREQTEKIQRKLDAKFMDAQMKISESK